MVKGCVWGTLPATKELTFRSSVRCSMLFLGSLGVRDNLIAEYKILNWLLLRVITVPKTE
jgi:hypothetical protein